MTHKQRFKALFSGESVDRIPVYFFGTWHETKSRWKSEGCETVDEILVDYGPQVPGMDPDWELGLWDCHGFCHGYPIGDIETVILEETDSYYIKRGSVGEIYRESKIGSSINQTVEYGLKPTRESWENFKKYLDPNDPRRKPSDWMERARKLNEQDRVITFMGGSLYGWLRGLLGIEAISLLMYDDRELFEDMVSYMADYFKCLFEPILDIIKFDFVYFFEDCCGVNGPLFSPVIYKEIFDTHYKQLISFYKSKGVGFALIDSDGVVDKLVPSWLSSGFDIIFPVEVGTWGESPSSMRDKFGENLKMLGGVDKHIIIKGEQAIQKHLERLKPEVIKGGYIPIPDHRIPPECSYEQFLVYIKVFNEVFNT